MLNVLFEGASPLQATVLEALDCSQGQEGQVTVAATGCLPAADFGAACYHPNEGTSWISCSTSAGPRVNSKWWQQQGAEETAACYADIR